MSSDIRQDALGELKRYLLRRRREGLSVIHRLDDTGLQVGEPPPSIKHRTEAAVNASVDRVEKAREHPPEASVKTDTGREERASEHQAATMVKTSTRRAEGAGKAPSATTMKTSAVRAEKDAGSPPAAAAGKSGRAEKAKDSHPAGGASARQEGQTIRYRSGSPSAAQSNLFAHKGVAEGPDLSGCDLESLDHLVSTCTRCALSEGRNKTVFGAGAPDSKIVFIGEAPGRDEDMQGLPFVGRAGKLLTKILASVGLNREEVYITNILKCRPPNNRDPREDEVRACGIYLKRQLELINPVLICALGRVAGQNLLDCGASLSVLREGVHYYDDIMVLVMYHPAALLRNPNLKRDAWEDIKRVRRIYDEAMEKS